MTTRNKAQVVSQLVQIIARRREGGVSDAAIKANLIAQEGWPVGAVIEAFDELAKEGGV